VAGSPPTPVPDYSRAAAAGTGKAETPANEQSSAKTRCGYAPRWGAPVATLRAASTRPDDSDMDDVSPAPGVHVTASNFRPAGMSDSESDSSDVQFPELSGGVVEDLDIDADPWMGPGPAQAELPEIQFPEVHLVDAAAGPDAPITYAEAATQEDGDIRAGLPCGIPAAVLAASQPQCLLRLSAPTPDSRQPPLLTGWRRDRLTPANCRFCAGRQASRRTSRGSPLNGTCSGPQAPGRTPETITRSTVGSGRHTRPLAAGRVRPRAAM